MHNATVTNSSGHGECAPEMRKDMAVYTLSKVNEKSVARRLSGDKAIEVQDHMGLELR